MSSSSSSEGRRLSDDGVWGMVSPERRYRVVVNTFMGGGGDFYDILKEVTESRGEVAAYGRKDIKSTLEAYFRHKETSGLKTPTVDEIRTNCVGSVDFDGGDSTSCRVLRWPPGSRPEILICAKDRGLVERKAKGRDYS